MIIRTTVVSGVIVLAVFAIIFIFGAVTGNGKAEAEEAAQPNKLMVLWTSADREVAIKMVYMYAYNAKKNGWWDEVRFVIWGPSSKLLSEDTEIQEYLKKMKDEGVIIEACQACADMYGVSDKLRAMGVDVKYMGMPVTDMLKSGYASMTF
jgi:hypothetical protein